MLCLSETAKIGIQREAFLKAVKVFRDNPFREAHEILLSFLDNFDKVAGMKAK
jgi:hypothetical protein